MSLVAYAIPLATHRGVHVFGENLVGKTNINYTLLGSTLILDYSTGWHGIPPKSGGLYDLPGIIINRSVVTLTGQTRGDALVSIRIQWWLALLANAAALLATFLLARPLFRRPSIPGLCPGCGYDLRATPDANGPLLDRCPECGMCVPAKATAG